MIRPDTTRCYVCGGEFAGELTIIDNRAMHPRCSAEIDRLTSERDQHAEELEHNQSAVIQLKAEIERLRANQERMWCKACGTVTRDRQCDCTKSPDQDTQSLVNYADAMQEAAHEEAQENERLREALKPFGDAITQAENDALSPDQRLEHCRTEVTLYEFSNARAALNHEQNARDGK